MYNGFITKLTNVRSHSNADRLQLGDCFGNTVCVSLDYKEGDIGVYFPTDGQLSEEFCEYNNLVRKKDDAGNNIGGYMDPAKRNVCAIRLRGEKSDGLFLPLSCLDFCFEDGAAAHLKEGDRIDVVNGHHICNKYIPIKRNKALTDVVGNRTRKKKVPIAPLFSEHADTEQLAYNLSAFKPNDEIEITLKMHGTSQRTGYVPTLIGYTHSNPIFRKIIHHLYHKEKLGSVAQKLLDHALVNATPLYDWGYVSGTRRTVLDNYEGGYYGDNSFREKHSKTFEGKLNKGETVYYEVVGFTDNGTPIMANADNKKLNDKEFIKKYGEVTQFSYGCEPKLKNLVVADATQDELTPMYIPIGKQSDIYVYRMTMTNEDGFVVEYTPDFMRYRCEQMGVKCVPVLWKGIITPTSKYNDCQEYDCWCNGWIGTCGGEESIGNMVKKIAEHYYDGPDPIGKTHVREGVVVRILNRPKFCAYKHKNFNFKVLSGIAIEAATEAGILDDISEDILAEM